MFDTILFCVLHGSLVWQVEDRKIMATYFKPCIPNEKLKCFVLTNIFWISCKRIESHTHVYINTVRLNVNWLWSCSHCVFVYKGCITLHEDTDNLCRLQPYPYDYIIIEDCQLGAICVELKLHMQLFCIHKVVRSSTMTYICRDEHAKPI